VTELRPIRLDAELPYGLAENDRLVPVEEVPRGLACNCRCPQCDRRLVAKQGEIVRWHFAHEAEGIVCAGAFETMVHWLAKQIIADANAIKIPPLTGYFQGTARRVVEPTREIAIANVQLEARVTKNIRPDILVRCEDDTALAIEILVAHQVGADKIDRLRERQLATMEIDLSGFRAGLLSARIFAEAVLHSPGRKWLWHPRQANADALVAAEVEAQRTELRLAAEKREALRRAAEEKARAEAAEVEAEAVRRYAGWQRRMAEEAAQAEERKRIAAAERERWVQVTSEARAAFLRSRPTVIVADPTAPTCQCRTLFLWRVGALEHWRCFTCDPPDHGSAEVVRASIPGRPVWDPAARQWIDWTIQ
jgi:hypothetical protein